MDLHDLPTVLSAQGPFVTVLVESESDVEQAADKYELQWRNVLSELDDKGVDARTRDAISAERGRHSDGAARLVVATVPDATVRLAVSLGTPPRRQVVDVSALPHLLPLVDDVTTRVPHVVVLADRTGADVRAYYDSDHLAGSVTVTGHAPDIRKVPGGGWSQLHYQHRAENGWAANAQEIVTAVADLARQVRAQLVVLVGDERELGHVRRALPHDLPAVVELPGGRGADGSGAQVRADVVDALSRHLADATLDLLAAYAQERGQDKRACDGLPDVLEALRKAQVQTLLITTDTEQDATLWFGPEPSQVAATVGELVGLGVATPQEGPLVDVLLRAALGTGADVQLVPGEMDAAPRMGLGAVLRYTDSPGGSRADSAARQ